MLYANNSGQISLLIGAFVICCLDSIKPKVAIWEIPRLSSFCSEQAGLNLIWLQNPEDRFAHDLAHFQTHLSYMGHIMAKTNVQMDLRIAE